MLFIRSPEVAKQVDEDENRPAQSGLDEKSHDHSVTFAPMTPAKDSEQSGDACADPALYAIRCLSFAQTFISNGM